MADDGLILAYLRELHYSVARLADADAIVEEAEDHLLEAAARLTALGARRAEAEAEAVARFGSAALVARVCVTEAKRGVSVPTTRTRYAGLALVLAPLFVVFGQLGNVTVKKGGLHGFAVTLIGLAFPLLVFGLWGLRARHGGLGRLGLTAVILAAVSPILSLAAMYGAIILLAFLLGVALVMFAVEMLRASVLPVVPLVLMAAGPIVFVIALVGVAITDVYDGLAVLLPLSLTAIGLAWLGWFLWREPAVDAPRRRRSIARA